MFQSLTYPNGPQIQSEEKTIETAKEWISSYISAGPSGASQAQKRDFMISNPLFKVFRYYKYLLLGSLVLG